jgi:hypothetical protein
MWHIADGRGNYTNQEGLFAVALPGYEIKDYTMSATYIGEVEADGQCCAGIEFTVSPDIDSFKFAVLPGNITEFADVAEAIVAGSTEFDIYDADASPTSSQLSWAFYLSEAGVYTVVAVPYDDGKAKVNDAIAHTFYFAAGGEAPNASVEVYMDSVVNLTGEMSYEDAYPSGYYAVVGIKANPNEVRSVKMYVGRADIVAGSGMKGEEIVAGYGDDVTNVVLNGLQANGSIILGPYNLQSGTENVALVSVETHYGETKFFDVYYTLPNATGVELGNYTITEGDYNAEVAFLGGYEAGVAYFAIDGLEYEGKIDATAKTITFDGYELNYSDAQNPSLFNQVLFYYDNERTQAYGFWSASDKDLQEASDLVFSFDEAGVVNALKNYFAMCVYNLADYSFAGYGFYFTPEATIYWNGASYYASRAEAQRGAPLLNGVAPCKGNVLSKLAR